MHPGKEAFHKPPSLVAKKPPVILSRAFLAIRTIISMPWWFSALSSLLLSYARSPTMYRFPGLRGQESVCILAGLWDVFFGKVFTDPCPVLVAHV